MWALGSTWTQLSIHSAFCLARIAVETIYFTQCGTETTLRATYFHLEFSVPADHTCMYRPNGPKYVFALGLAE
ncbi:hypothetical protein A0H81_13365 [Grifola frondosa]|uniref:Secreted protein n=1 Tax=Grifola frondosa TaxID=5627 RepID=A0A1C7LRX0_GRIFR|nr:hypothetical protein A0H81_13365 [Grifola frondosa]